MTHTHTHTKTTTTTKRMFLCLAAWPANARSACTGVMLRLCSLHVREKRRRGGGGGKGGFVDEDQGGGGGRVQERRMKEGESGRLEEELGGGGGAGGVYFLWEDRWRRLFNSPTVPAETTLLSKLFHSPLVLRKKLFLKTGVEACWM